jgi:hypothetical protein
MLRITKLLVSTTDAIPRADYDNGIIALCKSRLKELRRRAESCKAVNAAVANLHATTTVEHTDEDATVTEKAREIITGGDAGEWMTMEELQMQVNEEMGDDNDNETS